MRAGAPQQLNQGLKVDLVDSGTIDFHDFIPRTQSRAPRRRPLGGLKHQYFPGRHIKNGTKTQRLATRLLLQKFELVFVEERTEGVESREHAPDAAIQDRAIGIDRIRKILLDGAVGLRKLQALDGDLVRRGREGRTLCERDRDQGGEPQKVRGNELCPALQLLPVVLLISITQVQSVRRECRIFPTLIAF